MKKLIDKRLAIDQIDNQIMALLDKRLQLCNEIGQIKLELKMKASDVKREENILRNVDNYHFNYAIKNIYRAIFTESKKIQAIPSYLVGKKIGHSFSKTIHQLIGNTNYQLKEITDLHGFIDKRDFLLINVTNPYKKDAYNLVDELSPLAEKTQSVNTIIKADGKLIGYNTDYIGFKNLLKYYEINLNHKKIAIIGNGSTAKTIRSVLEDFDAVNIEIINLVRQKKSDYDILITDYQMHLDTNIIINATTYGVYPNLERDFLFDLKQFNNLTDLIDINYNPFRSSLYYTNPEVIYYNGLYMLVDQAVHSEKLINNFNMSTSLICQDISLKYINIVLIGMPFSGKSSIAQLLGPLLNKLVIDMDEELKKRQLDLSTCLANGHNIEYYRKQENNLAKELALMTNCVISTGGGIVEMEENMLYLRQNSIIILIDTPLEMLIERFDLTRPLLKTVDDLKDMMVKRRKLYFQYADIVIDNINDLQEMIIEIKDKIYEYFNY